MAHVHLTHRALEDLQEIYDYSLVEWGEQVADSYLEAFQEFFVLVESSPQLLITKSGVSARFKVHQVKKHWLICDIHGDDIFVLAIRHMSMNVLERLSDLEPNLERESFALFNELKKRRD